MFDAMTNTEHLALLITCNAYVLCQSHAQVWLDGGWDGSMREAERWEVEFADGCCDCLDESITAVMFS